MKIEIIKNLNSIFRIDVYQKGASEEDILQLINFSCINIPEEYFGIIKKMTEIEILVDNSMYIRLWNPLRCIEMNEAYFIQKYIPNSLAIGDDEGCKALIYMTGNKGFGLYKVSFGDLDIEDSEYICKSLIDLLIYGSGYKTLLY